MSKKRGSDLTLDGKPFALKRMGTVAQSIPVVLDKLQTGSFLSSRELAHRLGCTANAIHAIHQQASGSLSAYYIDAGYRLLWGSKNSIREAEAILASHD